MHSPHPLLIPTKTAAQIVTIHDLDFLDNPDRTNAEIKRDYPRLARLHANRARHVIVPSRFTAEEVKSRLGVPMERISVCYNGAPTWPPRNKYPDKGHILFVGSMGPRKNINSLLDAYSQLLDSEKKELLPKLLLVGPLTSQSVDSLNRIKSPPLEGRANYLGYVDSQSLQKLYEDALLVVLPSFHEGFGLPVVEAMSVGVPVIVSNRGALPEVIGDAGIVIDPTRTDDLAKAMLRILSDKPFVSTCIKKGFNQASKFTWAESAESLLRTYRQTLNT